MESLIERARAIAADEDAGASEIVRGLLPVLQHALSAGPEATRELVRVVCRTQPSMAPVWNACAAAVADLTSPGRFARFQEAQAHQQRAVVRVASDAIAELARGSADPTIVTWSYSGTVAAVLSRVAATKRVTVICAEGRPRFEGRRLATTLWGSGARVILMTDAAATSGLERASAILVGADAILATCWINKVGTRGLAAGALHVGCPVVVVATRDKAVAPVLEGKLELRAGRLEDVWAAPPEGIEIASPVFERIPAELATWFATDAGLLTPSDLPTFVRRNQAELETLISVL